MRYPPRHTGRMGYNTHSAKFVRCKFNHRAQETRVTPACTAARPPLHRALNSPLGRRPRHDHAWTGRLLPRSMRFCSAVQWSMSVNSAPSSELPHQRPDSDSCLNQAARDDHASSTRETVWRLVQTKKYTFSTKRTVVKNISRMQYGPKRFFSHLQCTKIQPTKTTTSAGLALQQVRGESKHADAMCVLAGVRARARNWAWWQHLAVQTRCCVF
jgi:hypothetical protein